MLRPEATVSPEHFEKIDACVPKILFYYAVVMAETEPPHEEELWMMRPAVFFEKVIAPALWVIGVVTVCLFAHHDQALAVVDKAHPVSLAFDRAP